MRDADTPSFSAALVASMRGVASRLPATRGIAQDDVSWVWARARLPRLYDAAPRTMRFILWVSGYNRFAADMAVRTRVIDDAVLDFVSAGGKQLVLLGAGYDARAVRLASQLNANNVEVFEVDSPGTQLLKRAAVARLPAATPRAVAWHFEAIDFELHKPADMAAKLAAQGLDPSRRTLVLMEGLVPYLTPVAADETVRAARTLGAPGSRLVMDEVPPALLRRWFINPLGIFTFLAFRLVAGERFRICGWPDAEVGPYLAARGWSRLLARSPLGETAPAAALPRSLRSGMGACARLVVAEAQ